MPYFENQHFAPHHSSHCFYIIKPNFNMYLKANNTNDILAVLWDSFGLIETFWSRYLRIVIMFSLFSQSLICLSLVPWTVFHQILNSVYLEGLLFAAMSQSSYKILVNQRKNLSRSIIIPQVKHGRPNYRVIESNQSLHSLEIVFKNSILNTVGDQFEWVPIIRGVSIFQRSAAVREYTSALRKHLSRVIYFLLMTWQE